MYVWSLFSLSEDSTRCFCGASDICTYSGSKYAKRPVLTAFFFLSCMQPFVLTASPLSKPAELPSYLFTLEWKAIEVKQEKIRSESEKVQGWVCLIGWMCVCDWKKVCKLGFFTVWYKPIFSSKGELVWKDKRYNTGPRTRNSQEKDIRTIYSGFTLMSPHSQPIPKEATLSRFSCVL